MPGSSKAAAVDNTAEHPSCFSDTHGILTSTTFEIPGHRTSKSLGSIFGITVQSRNWGSSLGGMLKSSIGGELKVFTTMMYKARNEAMDRMVGECMARGGNAILGVRFDISSSDTWIQVCAYGTAAVVEEMKDMQKT